MSNETELKLALSPAALTALRAHPLIAGAPREGVTETLINTYYDTPALDLRRDRIALRLRDTGTRRLQTIKCAASSAGGLSSRPEWEHPYDGERFDFTPIDVPAVRQRMESLRDRLVPVFTTNFVRETRRIAPARGVVILAMMDHGQIEAAGRSAPLCELELELVSGKPAELFAFALELVRTVPLAPEDASKAQRGYALFSATPDKPEKPRSSKLEAGLDASEAFRTIAFELLRVWQANSAHLVAHPDPEFVHQARVALRRLRSAISLFKNALPSDFIAEWRPRLRSLAGEMGVTRDADVLFHTMLEPISASGPVSKDLKRLIDRVERRRQASRAALADSKRHAAHGRAQLELAAALHALPASSGKAIEDLARDAMRRTRRRARAAVEAAEAAAPDNIRELHRLRIELKRLRYGIDFFSSLWPKGSHTTYSQTLAALQEDLGALNDAAVGDRLLAELAGDDPGLNAAKAFATGWHAPRIAHLRLQATGSARALLWTRPPWKAGHD